jgi:hypothetical protein
VRGFQHQLGIFFNFFCDGDQGVGEEI